MTGPTGTTTDADRDVLASQYTEICKAHGAITDFRSKLLALFPVAAGGSVLVIVKGGNAAGSASWARPVGLFAFAVTLGLFLYEIRQIAECIRLRHQAAAIEEMLGVPPGVGQFRDGPALQLRVVGVELGSWVVYVTLLAAWLYIATVAQGPTPVGSWTAVLLTAAGATLVAKIVQIVVRDAMWSRRRQVQEFLHRQPGTARHIAARLRLPVWIVVAALAQLEANGHARRTEDQSTWTTTPPSAAGAQPQATDSEHRPEPVTVSQHPVAAES